MKKLIFIFSLLLASLPLSAQDLVFPEDLIGENTDAQKNVTLSNDYISITFTTNSTSAKIDKSNGYFGTADDYITIPVRYRPGGKSNNGINSPNKAVITAQRGGKLTIYAYNNQKNDDGTPNLRSIQVIQNDKSIFEHQFSFEEGVAVGNITVYPVYTVEIEEGTSYLLWPDNQLMMYGFSFEPIATLPFAPQTAELFFTMDLTANNLYLEHNNTSIAFSTGGTPVIDESTGYYGTVDNYIAFPVRYRPGGSSTKGIDSPSKAVFTFPCSGTLYIYAHNTSTTENRTLQLIQDDETIFEHSYASTEYKSPEGKSTKIYPVKSVEVNKGTAYLLWPEGQHMLHGFRFVPEKSLFIHITDEYGNFSYTFNHQIYDVPYVATKLDKDTYQLRDVYFSENEKYFILADALFDNTENESISWKDLPEGTRLFYLSTDTEEVSTMANEPSSAKLVVGSKDDENITPFTVTEGPKTLIINMNEDGNGGNVDLSYNPTTGVEEVTVMPVVTDGRMYNLMGQPVDENYRGIVIKDGKKFINR